MHGVARSVLEAQGSLFESTCETKEEGMTDGPPKPPVKRYSKILLHLGLPMRKLLAGACSQVSYSCFLHRNVEIS